MAVLVSTTEARGKIIKGRQLQEPDVDQMDMSLFREHEEGFPGGLFYEDTEGEAELQQMVPQWRQTGKSKGGSKGWKSKKKCKKSRRNLQTGKGGSKGCSSKGGGSPSYGGWGGQPSPWYGYPTPSQPVTAPTWPSSPSWPTSPTAPSSPITTPSMPVAVPVSVPVSPISSDWAGQPTDNTGSLADNDGPTGPTERDWDANDAVCTSIANSNNIQSGGPAIAFNDLSLDVDMDLRVRSKNNLNVPALLNTYSKFVRLYCLGCFDEADTELGTLTRRRLLTEPLFQATMNSWFEDGTTCVGEDPKTCDYFNSIWVYYQNNGNDEPDEAEVKERVREALSVIAQALEGHPDVDDVAVDSVAVSQAVGDNNGAGSTTSAGTIVGATAGALAALLLLLFLAKRNKDSDEVSHLKFVEDDETFVNEFEGKSGDSDSDSQNRRVHVVGESDSVMSGWTGYSVDEDSICSDADRSGKLGHQMGDVHICSSATCETCERRRQMGVTFIKTTAPPMPERTPSIPRDATREYVAEDVVAL